MERVRIGSLAELREHSHIQGKVENLPICVFWSDEKAYALVDRCPHMGFPLHRGTVEDGLLTCHWHHAQFDLSSGGTLDPFADDAQAHLVEIDGDDVFVTLTQGPDDVTRHAARLLEGLEQNLTLVTAKAVIALTASLGDDAGALEVIRVGSTFGIARRDQGWGVGMTVLSAVANVLPLLVPSDRALALTHALRFVARDAQGHPPRSAISALDTDVSVAQLSAWYQRFSSTRDGDAAERALTTAITVGASTRDAVAMMGAVVTDHVLLDGGHTIDFTNKAFELLELLGWDDAARVLPTLARQTAFASRAEEQGHWHHPDDLVALIADAPSADTGVGSAVENVRDAALSALAWSILEDAPRAIVASLNAALEQGATFEQLARALCLAAALRIARFHVQNDHGDWDVVHHAFTAANALHHLLQLAPTRELARGIYQGAMRVYLDRFLNIPSARPPASRAPNDARVELSALQRCFDREGMVDEAGAIVYAWLQQGGSREDVLSTLGAALFEEDAEFHWIQVYEAGARQARCWEEGSEECAMILVGITRFLAAHTPTRRELSKVVSIAARIRRGDALYDEGA